MATSVVFDIKADISSFNKAVQQFVSGVSKMEQSVGSLAGSVNSQTSEISNRFDSVSRSTQDLSNQLDTNLSRALGRASRQGAALGTTIGIVAASAIRNLISELSRLSSATLVIWQRARWRECLEQENYG